tara:strand:+ start:20 stop:469 length:450 start_codon:yes stop_codon:yes gene_type:complete
MATEKIGTISNRLILDLLKNSLKAGSISQSEYDDLVKDFFPAPKLVQGDLFEDDNKKAEGGMMDINNMTRPLNFEMGGMAAEDEGKTFGRGEFSYDDPNLINFIQRRADQNDTTYREELMKFVEEVESFYRNKKAQGGIVSISSLTQSL